MNIGILGSASVAQPLGSALIEHGHSVMLGTRDPAKLDGWKSKAGKKASVGSFAQAAAFGQMVFNCTNGQNSLAALKSVDSKALDAKVIVDVANPLDFSRGMPPSLTVCNTDSLAEQIQRAYPKAKVVKALNTVTASLMVNPGLLKGGEHTLFICGNDPTAKAEVIGVLKKDFGWKDVMDVGDLSAARGTEMLLALWVRLFGALGTPMFNFKVVRS